MVYHVRLSNGQRVRVHIFVVYDRPDSIQHVAKPGEDCFQWTCVQRASCKKGCEGPILRAIQRYGRLGRCAAGLQLCAGADDLEGDAALRGVPQLAAPPQYIRWKHFALRLPAAGR